MCRCYYISTVAVLVFCCGWFLQVDAYNDTYDTYDKFTRPYHGGIPVNVTTKVYIRNLNSIDEKSFTYKIDFIIYHWYNDPRLSVTRKSPTFLNKLHFVDQVWFPNLGLINCRDVKDVRNSQSLKIKPNGDVFAHKRYTAQCYCLMHLEAFPMDTQYCPFKLESYFYSTADITLNWYQPAVQFEEGLNIVGYHLEDPLFKKFTMTYEYGVWEVLEVKFVFGRVFLHYIYRVYIPIVLVMIFNFTSYWVPYTAVPARVTLIITTFLTMTFILQSVSAQTSKSSTTTSLQLFIVVSIVLVVVAIIEFLFVLVFSTKEKNPSLRWTVYKNCLWWLRKVDNDHVSHPNGQCSPMRELETTRYNVILVDQFFRCTIPLVYIIFCVCYFVYFLSLASIEQQHIWDH